MCCRFSCTFYPAPEKPFERLAQVERCVLRRQMDESAALQEKGLLLAMYLLLRASGYVRGAMPWLLKS